MDLQTSALTITTILVTISFILNIVHFSNEMENMNEEIHNEYVAVMALFVIGYFIPKINKELHIVFTVILLAMLGRLSADNSAITITALALYGSACCVGHLMKYVAAYTIVVQ